VAVMVSLQPESRGPIGPAMVAHKLKVAGREAVSSKLNT